MSEGVSTLAVVFLCPPVHTYNLVLILTRHTLARAGLANRLF